MKAVALALCIGLAGAAAPAAAGSAQGEAAAGLGDPANPGDALLSGTVPASDRLIDRIDQRFKASTDDPRFAIAFLISPRGRELAAGTSFAAEMSRAHAKAFGFIDSNPSSPSLQSVRALLVDIKN